MRFYVFALILIAFGMEMAYMYPWAIVFESLGWVASAEVGLFLTVLGMGILYAWREAALDRRGGGLRGRRRAAALAGGGLRRDAALTHMPTARMRLRA
ncbi:MAG: NADH-quinone oxidoreductase subunit A, partial [Thermoleophilaceae bacterium]